MKKFLSLALISASLLSVAACANKGSADYGYETKAPYADERTVGADQKPVKKADKVFKARQAK